MEIQEMQKLRAKMQSDMCELIKDFEEATGIKVTYITYESHHTYFEGGKVCDTKRSVNIDVKL